MHAHEQEAKSKLLSGAKDLNEVFISHLCVELNNHLDPLSPDSFLHFCIILNFLAMALS